MVDTVQSVEREREDARHRRRGSVSELIAKPNVSMTLVVIGVVVLVVLAAFVSSGSYGGLYLMLVGPVIGLAFLVGAAVTGWKRRGPGVPARPAAAPAAALPILHVSSVVPGADMFGNIKDWPIVDAETETGSESDAKPEPEPESADAETPSP
jgi:hypothetical protein